MPRNPNEFNPNALNFALGIFIAFALFGVVAMVQGLPQFRVLAPIAVVAGAAGAIAIITLRIRFKRK